MQKYKGDYYNPETFEKTEIETEISNDLVIDLKQLLKQLDRYETLESIFINPDNKSVYFGIINLEDRSSKYRISITKLPI